MTRRLCLLVALLISLNVPANVHAQPAPAPLPATAGFVETITYTNHYDGSTQQALVQLPDGYTPDLAYPVLVFAHSRLTAMDEGITLYNNAANNMGWLLVSPELHGRWPNPPNPPGQFHYASLESQYDLLGAVEYMLDHYHVDRDRIYVAGNSMGGLLATVAAAKYPDVFAGVYANKSPSDLTTWYADQVALFGAGAAITIRQECYTGSEAAPTPQPPANNPFCYARRSTLSYASNLRHTPLGLTHSALDQQVPVTHTLRLSDTVGSLPPDHPVAVHIDTYVAPTCPQAYYHCFMPWAEDVLGLLSRYPLHRSPYFVDLVTDESKSFYWLDIGQSGGDHFTRVQAAADLGTHSVTLVVSDTQPLSLKINLGSTPTEDWIGLSHAGLGFLPGSYHVAGAGLNENVQYTSGYLTLNLPPTTNTTITIARNGVVRSVWLPSALR